jgi:hypothetical protein
MLSAMKSGWMKLLISTVAIVALGSMAIGLATPDGTVGDRAQPVNQGPRPTPTTPAPTPADTADEAIPSADLAPAAVAGIWPGRPDAVVLEDDRVDWCGAIETTGAAEAERLFGRQAVVNAACTAVSFIFDHRYSELSVPRATYTAADLDRILPALEPSTAREIYRPRIAAFIAGPRSDQAGEQLGLVIFRAPGTPTNADHASAGPDHVFYGPAFSSDGYRDRAVWINPTWTSVSVSVDRSAKLPRIKAALKASASLPVFNRASGTDAMLTVPTSASFVLNRADDGQWRISGWTISRGTASFAPLSVQ